MLKDNPSLAEEKILVPEVYRQNFLNQLLTGWRAFAREPAALAMLAYSFLWLSALSPHGVLLTSFLKDGWQLPEWEIGIFRGLGAVFGLAATFLFPILVRKTGLIGGSRNCLWFQAATLLLAMGFFFLGERVGQLGFLLLILFSRIGLYGFGLGEMEIRQRSILPGSRGRVNGFAHALNNVGTLSLFVVGILVGSASAFGLLVAFSCAAVLVAAALFQRWIKFNNESFK